MRAQRSGSGFVLLEALIAIFIFSLGILGVVAFQSAASRLSTDSTFRTEASFYAEELVADMMVSPAGNLISQFSSPSGLAYTAWKTKRLSKLPSGSATVVITQDSHAKSDSYVAEITINWIPPGVKDPDEIKTYRYVTTALVYY